MTPLFETVALLSVAAVTATVAVITCRLILEKHFRHVEGKELAERHKFAGRVDWSTLLVGIPILFSFIVFRQAAGEWLIPLGLALAPAALTWILVRAATSELVCYPIISRRILVTFVFVAITLGASPIATREMHFLPPFMSYAILMPSVFVLGLAHAITEFGWTREPEAGGKLGVMTLLSIGVVGLLVPGIAKNQLPPVKLLVSFPSELEDHVRTAHLEDSSVKWSRFGRILLSANDLGYELAPDYPREQLIHLRDTPMELGVTKKLRVWTEAARAGLLPEVWNDSLHTIAERQLRSHSPWLAEEEWCIQGLFEQGALSATETAGLVRSVRRRWPELPGRAPSATDRTGAFALEQMWEVTRLLDALGQPLRSDERRERVHDWLSRCWIDGTPPIRSDRGGFGSFPGAQRSDLDATWLAIQLMKAYGVPEGIDFAWVRSYLQPWNHRFQSDPYTARLCLEELDALGVPGPTALDWLYAERKVVLSLLIVGLWAYVLRSTWRTAVARAEEASHISWQESRPPSDTPSSPPPE